MKPWMWDFVTIFCFVTAINPPPIGGWSWIVRGVAVGFFFVLLDARYGKERT